MGRVVRTLLKVPAVRRVMARLWTVEDSVESSEAAIREQQVRLAEIMSTLADQWATLSRLSADREGDQARSADMATRLDDQRGLLTRLSADQDRDRLRSADTAKILGDHHGLLTRLRADQDSDRVRSADLAATLSEQRGLLASLSADQESDRARSADIATALSEQGGMVARLRADQDSDRASSAGIASALSDQASLLARFSADQESLRARLVEVAAHMPPEERLRLEMTLQQLETTFQGQQLQLSALNSAAQSQQSQLQALHEVVGQVNRQIADTVKGIEGARELAKLELAAAERLKDQHSLERPRVDPYTFEQLLNRQVEPYGPDLVFHVHIPKTAGTTTRTLFQQNKFLALDFDMTTQSFFESVREDRWLENYRRPPPRARYVMTGHFRLDLPMLRQMRMHHAIATLLRDPMERVLSHYNYTVKVEGNPWRQEVLAGTMSFIEYAEWLHAAIGPQYSFFDDTGAGTFARSGTASAERCLNNLLTRVAMFGLTDRFDEYCVLVGYLVGRGKLLAVGRDKVTVRIASEHDAALKAALTDEERVRVSKLFADDIWFYEEAVKEYERRISDPRLQAVLAKTMPLIARCDEAMEQLVSLRDPANPDRPAFAPVLPSRPASAGGK
jgi:hypothetical protein